MYIDNYELKISDVIDRDYVQDYVEYNSYANDSRVRDLVELFGEDD